MTAEERKKLIKKVTSKEFGEMVTSTLASKIKDKRVGKSMMDFYKPLHGQVVKNTSGV